MIRARKRTLLRVLVVILLLMTGMIWLNRRSLFQEGNFIAILPTLMRLETSRADILPATPDNRLLISKMSFKHTAIDRYLAKRGWSRNDQEGGLLPYHRGKENLDVRLRIYLHGRYWAYELNRRP